MTAPAVTFTACPDPACTDPASVTDPRDLPSTDGDVAHVRVVCLHRKHRFFMPVPEGGFQ